MKKRWMTIAMAAAMMMAAPFAAMAEEGEATAVTTVGPEDGTHFEMLVFRGCTQ